MIPHNRWVPRPEYSRAVQKVLKSGHIAQGYQVGLLEDALTARYKLPAVCVSSGTAALYLAMIHSPNYNLAGVSGVVSFPTYACSAFLCAARMASRPVRLLDCGPDSVNPVSDGQSIVIHMHGNQNPVTAAEIEDLTHAPTFSPSARLSVISFGATKPLGAGAGGAILGPESVISQIRAMRDYDSLIEPPYNRTRLGQFNWQMSDLHAAIALSRLERLDEESEWRARVAERYLNCLDPITISLGDFNRSWYRFILMTESNRQPEVMKILARKGVESIIPLRSDELLHRQTYNCNPCMKDFPNAELIARTSVSVPIWPGMRECDVSDVARALRSLRRQGYVDSIY